MKKTNWVELSKKLNTFFGEIENPPESNRDITEKERVVSMFVTKKFWNLLKKISNGNLFIEKVSKKDGSIGHIWTANIFPWKNQEILLKGENGTCLLINQNDLV